MAGHSGKTRVDLPHLAGADAVDGGPHVDAKRARRVVEDTPAWNTTQRAKSFGQGVEQHLVGLQPVGPDHKGPAVRQLGVCGL
jgi:hypothetical protein